MRIDLDLLRNALLITLSILVLVLLFRRFRQRVLARDMPAPRHAELLNLRVAYHPARLVARVRLPGRQRVALVLRGAYHAELRSWPEEDLPAGDHDLERPLDGIADGDLHLEVRTATQRTVRRFRLQRT